MLVIDVPLGDFGRSAHRLLELETDCGDATLNFQSRTESSPRMFARLLVGLLAAGFLLPHAYVLAQSPDAAESRPVTRAAKRSAQREPAYAFLRIQHVRQKERLCATASASMALSHYGVKMDQVVIKQLANSVTKKPEFPGTFYIDLVNGLKTQGIHWKRNPHPVTAEGFQAGMETIRESIFAGRPVIVDTNLAPIGHTMLVNGIDTRRQLISLINPNRPSPGLQTFSFEQFEKIWRSKTANVRGSVLTFPPEQSDAAVKPN